MILRIQFVFDRGEFSLLTKREALDRMGNLQVDNLPVIDEDGAFVGTVNRSQLTASLILEIARRLDGAVEEEE